MNIDHLGIAVEDIEASLGFWRDALGLVNVHTELVEDQMVKVAMLPVGETNIELLEATSSESPVAKFIDKRGPGIHHIAVEVDDIEKSLERMKTAGVKLIDEAPRMGAGGCLIAFVHPKSTGGVLMELVQKPNKNNLQEVS